MFPKSSWALLAFAAILPISGAGAQPRALVLEGGTLIDGTGRAPLADAVIVVEGARIVAVGKRGEVAVPANANVIKLDGRTVLPGLIDSHTHTQDWQLPMFLPYGVTTIADENNHPAWILAQREALAKGRIKGPRMFVSGAIMHGTLWKQERASTNNYPDVKTVEDAKKHMRAMIALGVDILKVNNNITDEQLKAVVEIANEKNMPAFGHTQNILRAAELGWKHAEHTWTIGYALTDPAEKNPPVSPRDSHDKTPEAEIDPTTFPPLVDYMVKQGVYVNPTMANNWRLSSPRAKEFADEYAELIKDPGLGFIPDTVRKTWISGPRKRPGYENVKEFLRQYAEAGGKVVVGTDSGPNGEVVPGLSEHTEMQMLVDVGYSPMQAIQAATLWNAELLKKDKDLGSVEPGKLADFAIIEGDPLADIRATKKVRMTIKEGKVMDTKYDPHWVNPIPQPVSSTERNPPIIIGLSPATARQGSGTVTLTIEGEEQDHVFARNAVVRFDNMDLPTHFVSGTKLTATLDAKILERKPGSYVIYVLNPGLHGTVSEPAYFVVNLRE